MEATRVAIAQMSPVVLDAPATLDRIAETVGRAARDGVRLLVFPETFVPAYPVWCDGGRFGAWEDEPSKRIHAELIDNSLEVPSSACDRLGEMAGDARCALAVGINERVGRTLYNAILLFDEHGALRLHRRKLVPTHGERLVWKPGDAHDLTAVPAAGGRVGGLICWEHWMPLPRQALHDAGEEIHLALWPSVRDMYLLASRHYAFEGRCFVLCAGMILRTEDLARHVSPASLGLDPDAELLCSGGSAIIAPDGEVIAGPIHDKEDLLVADLDPARLHEEALSLDTSGHYARADLFRLQVDTRRLPTRPTDMAPDE